MWLGDSWRSCTIRSPCSTLRVARISPWRTTSVVSSTFRLPRMRVRAADGSDMERHPRQVDFPITRPIGETLVGLDTQVDEAIRQLLKKLGRAE